MTTNTVQLFAVTTASGKLYVESISPIERGAMVKWLDVYPGIKIPVGMGEFALRDLFNTETAKVPHELVKMSRISVTVIE